MKCMYVLLMVLGISGGAELLASRVSLINTKHDLGPGTGFGQMSNM